MSVTTRNLNFLITLPAAILGFIDIHALTILLHRSSGRNLPKKEDYQRLSVREEVGEGAFNPLDGIHETVVELGYHLVRSSLTGKIDADDPSVVPLELRSEFDSIDSLRAMTERMLSLIATFGRHTTDAVLRVTCSVLETLIQLTYVCPTALSLQGVGKILEILPYCTLPLKQRVCVLLANVLSREVVNDDGDDRTKIESALASTGDFLQRLLFDTNDDELRRYLTGVLTNLVAVPECVGTTLRASAVLRMCAKRNTWEYYVSNFALHLELARLLNNVAGNNPRALNDPLVVRYINAALRHSYRLVSKVVVPVKEGAGEEKEKMAGTSERFTLTFTQVDMPRIGLKMSWQEPHPLVKHVFPGGPAERKGEVRDQS